VSAGCGRAGSGAGLEAGGPDAGGVPCRTIGKSSTQIADKEPFSRTFDDRRLAFVYQENTSDGWTSRSSRFVSREG
jgi:hypothetical protein